MNNFKLSPLQQLWLLAATIFFFMLYLVMWHNAIVNKPVILTSPIPSYEKVAGQSGQAN